MFLAQTVMYMVDHYVTMEDGPVSVFAEHLLLCEVGAGHMDKSAPDAFNETIGALSFFRGCDDLGLFVVYTSDALAPDEFLIKVGIELAGKSAYVSAELREGGGDII